VIDIKAGFSLETIIPSVETEFKTINLGIIGNNFESTYEADPEPITRNSTPFYQAKTSSRNQKPKLSSTFERPATH
jgi:hypothetical protein